MRRPTRIADYRCHTGEGPLWHPDEERLYWVDIPNGRLYRYDPATGEHERCYETDVIGGFTVQADGSLLLFEDRGHIELWDGGSVRTVLEELPAERDSRFNDVIADPRGRVFCGTMPTDDRLGRLYRLDLDGTIVELRDDVRLPNGFGFTLDRRHLYFTESEAKRIYRFEYDQATGDIDDRETFVDLAGEPGIPDGMTVDAEGYVWSAHWDGGCLVRYDRTGAEVERLEFPARKVSSVTFGDADYDVAYVTTALTDSSREQEGEGAGSLYRIDLDVTGVPEFRSRIRV